MMKRKFALSLFLFASYFPCAFAQTFSSGDTEVRLVELYTSEGCSSCPDANRWISNLLDDPGLWAKFVPVAFHVDYWNDLGWPDPFSSPAYSQRQKTYREQGNVATVYTPGFVIQGEEWQGWFEGGSLPQSENKIVGKLSVDVQESRAKVRFEPASGIERGTLYFAWLGFGYDHAVSLGENKGKTLREDFVVLKVQEQHTELGDHRFQAEFDLPDPKAFDAQKLALVAWFSEDGNQRPIQAAGNWFRQESWLDKLGP